MKHRDLVNLHKDAGFSLKRHGADHDIYSRGKDSERVPRHRGINEMTAKAIIKRWGLK